MAARAGTAYVDFQADFSHLNKQVTSRLGGIGKQGATAGEKFGSEFGKKASSKISAPLKNTAKLIGAAFAVDRVFDFGKSVVSVASDVNESLSKNQVLFGKYAKDVEAFANTSAKSFGTSKKSALEYTGVFGNLFKALGVTNKQSSKFSVNLVKLAADMASFNNTSIEDALEAIRSGLVGETEPLRKFGVNINEAALTAEALASGLVKVHVDQSKMRSSTLKLDIAQRNLADAVKKHGANSTEAKKAQLGLETAQQGVNKAAGGQAVKLTAAQKALAAQQIIMKQTKAAHGDFARTSDQLANSQRILQARWEDAKATLGKQLLPYLLKGTKAVLNFADEMEKGEGPGGKFADTMKDIGSALVDVGGFLKDHARLVGAAALAWKGFKIRGTVLSALSTLKGKGAGGALGPGALGSVGQVAIKAGVVNLTGPGAAGGATTGTAGRGASGGAAAAGTAAAASYGSRFLGKLATVAKGAGRIAWPLAAADLAINLIDQKGNPINALVNTAHDLTFGLVPKVKTAEVKAEEAAGKTLEGTPTARAGLTKAQKQRLGALVTASKKANEQIEFDRRRIGEAGGAGIGRTSQRELPGLMGDIAAQKASIAKNATELGTLWAQGFVAGVDKHHTFFTQAQLFQGFSDQLKALPVASRAAGEKTMIDYARSLESQGRLPEGSAANLVTKIKAKFNLLPAGMGEAARKGTQGVSTEFNKQDMVNAANKQLATLKQTWGTGLGGLPPIATFTGKNAAGNFAKEIDFLKDKVKNSTGRAKKAAEEQLAGIQTAAVKYGKGATGGLIDQLKDMGIKGDPTARHSRFLIVKAFEQMATGVGKAGDDTAQALYEALSNMTANAQEVLEALGFDMPSIKLTKKQKAGKGAVSGTVAAQRGRYVSGSGSGDKYPIMAEAGEYVVNREAVKKVGKSTLDRINYGMFPRFRTGGAVQYPNVQGSKPGFGPIMAAFQRMFGRDIYVLSGMRPGSRVQGSGRVSNHAFGNAIDITNPASVGGTSGNPPAFNALDRLHSWIAGHIKKPPMLDFLWRTLVGGNHFNHIHLGLDPSVTSTVAAGLRYINSIGGGAGGLASEVMRQIVQAPDGILKDSAQGFIDKSVKAANSFISDKLSESIAAGGTSGGTTSGSSGSWEPEVDKIAQQRGWNAADWKWIIGQESGGKAIYNTEGSGAFGVGQLMPSNYNRLGGGPGSSLVEQVDAMASYIAERYGNPTKARAFWEAHGNYRRGGLVGMQLGGLGSKSTLAKGAAYKFKGKAAEQYLANLAGSKPVRTNAALVRDLSSSLAGIDYDRSIFDYWANSVDIDADWADVAAGLTDNDAINDALQLELEKRQAALTDKQSVDIAKALSTMLPSQQGKYLTEQIFPLAEQKAIVDSMQGRVQGLTQVDWLNEQLSDMLALRNLILHDSPLVQGDIDLVIAQLAQAHATSAQLEHEIDRLNTEIETFTSQRGNVSEERKRIDEAINSEEDKREKAYAELNAKKKPSKARQKTLHNNIDQYNNHLGNLHQRYDILTGGTFEQIAGLESYSGSHPYANKHWHSLRFYDDRLHQDRIDRQQDTAQKEQLDQVVIPAYEERQSKLETARDDLSSNLTSLQGSQRGGIFESPLTTLPDIGTLSGKFFAVQSRVADLIAHPPHVTADIPSSAPDTDPTRELLAEELRKSNLRYDVSQAQYKVFEDFKKFPAFGGSFAQGGTVPGPVGAPRMILAHGGEVVTPTDDGSPKISLHFAPGTEWLRNFVDVRVQQTTRGQARTGDRRLPGQAGVLR
jgi:hypothetical protein